jgi:AcrR family transcriptional regulator
MRRLTRTERREQTKAELVAAAGRVFLGKGFHQASLEEIAEEAGYTKGAVYSNFGSKDELFLAVLDDRYERQLRTQAGLLRQAPTFEDGLRLAARELSERHRRDPGWSPLLVEFWTHASRSPQLRQEALKRHQHQMDSLAVVLAEIGADHDIEFAVPPAEVARAANALSRGVALEQLVDPGTSVGDLFEDMFAAVVLSFTRPRGDAS